MLAKDLKVLIQKALLEAIQKTEYVSCELTKDYFVITHVSIDERPNKFSFKFHNMLSFAVNNYNEFDDVMTSIYYDHLYRYHESLIHGTGLNHSEKDYLKIFINESIREFDPIVDEVKILRDTLVNKLDYDANLLYNERQFEREVVSLVKNLNLPLDSMLRILKEVYNEKMIEDIHKS